MTSPAPYPTSGNAVPNRWHCDNAADASSQDCYVTSWQSTNDPSPAPAPTTTATTVTSSAYPGGYNTDDTGFGNWSSDWTNFLTGVLLVSAFCIGIAFMFMRWGRRAFR